MLIAKKGPTSSTDIQKIYNDQSKGRNPLKKIINAFCSSVISVMEEAEATTTDGKENSDGVTSTGKN